MHIQPRQPALYVTLSLFEYVLAYRRHYSANEDLQSRRGAMAKPARHRDNDGCDSLGFIKNRQMRGGAE